VRVNYYFKPKRRIKFSAAYQLAPKPLKDSTKIFNGSHSPYWTLKSFFKILTEAGAAIFRKSSPKQLTNQE
jgi:hypothetical protein